jgi:hypothetical protein
MSQIFDTLEYTKGAEAVGIKREHAEYQAQQLGKLVDNELVTKSYLHTELKDLENRMLIKLVGIMVVGITLLGFILKH